MSGWYEQAKEKLESEAKAGKYDCYAQVMKDRVCKKLLFFCQQDDEFAQAIVQGGTFEDCMKILAAEAKKCGSSGIADEDAYCQAVAFFFPGATIHTTMTVDLCGSVKDSKPSNGTVLNLSFSDFW